MKNIVNKVKKISYDELLVLFKFEIQYFKRYGLKTTFIGHPIYYINKPIDVSKNKTNIAFLPGSRINEIKKFY